MSECANGGKGRWAGVTWHEPSSAYDIYIAADVDALKDDNAELMRRYEAVVRENAELSAELDRLRQRAREEDWKWMDG